MSIVQQIQERQGASVGEAVTRMDEAAAEAARVAAEASNHRSVSFGSHAGWVRTF